MLVEIRKNVFIESTQVRTVFFSSDAGLIFIQLDSGQHSFKLLEGEDPDVVVPGFVQSIEAANRSHDVVITQDVRAIGDASITKTVKRRTKTAA